MYTVTDTLRDAKQKRLMSIKERYRALNRKQNSGANRLHALNTDQVADLRALKALQQTARSMQVRPFDSAGIVKFVFATATPVIVILASMLLF